MTKITFVSSGDHKITVQAKTGQTLMEVAVENDVPDIDADCEGGCACATCHVIIPDDYFNKVSPTDEDEKYLLDFLDNRTRNSRLSCQIDVTDELDGLIVTVPEHP